MNKKSKKFSETDFGKFVSKVGDVLPEVGNIAVSLVSGNYVGAVKEVGSIIKKGAEKKEEAKVLLQEFEQFQMEYEKECFELEAQDRKDARNLYSNDSLIQKLFSIIFLIGYGVLCWYMLDIIQGESEESELFKTMITMIFTGTSAKLNTIVDFFFGGSVTK